MTVLLSWPKNHAEYGVPYVKDGGLSSVFNLAQLHFHWGSDSTQGSEHTLQSKRYPHQIITPNRKNTNHQWWFQSQIWSKIPSKKTSSDLICKSFDQTKSVWIDQCNSIKLFQNMGQDDHIWVIWSHDFNQTSDHSEWFQSCYIFAMFRSMIGSIFQWLRKSITFHQEQLILLDTLSIDSEVNNFSGFWSKSKFIDQISSI